MAAAYDGGIGGAFRAERSRLVEEVLDVASNGRTRSTSVLQDSAVWGLGDASAEGLVKSFSASSGDKDISMHSSSRSASGMIPVIAVELSGGFVEPIVKGVSGKGVEWEAGSS